MLMDIKLTVDVHAVLVKMYSGGLRRYTAANYCIVMELQPGKDCFHAGLIPTTLMQPKVVGVVPTRNYTALVLQQLGMFKVLLDLGSVKVSWADRRLWQVIGGCGGKPSSLQKWSLGKHFNRIKLPYTSVLHNSILLACNFARKTARAKILSDLLWASYFITFGEINCKRFSWGGKSKKLFVA